MRLIYFSILLPCLFVVPRIASSATYYVDSSIATSGNGLSWASAWKGISNITGVRAGDTVYFSGGSSGQSYSVTDWTPIAGTKAAPVTYAVGQDAGHNGMVTFTGSGRFLLGNLTGVTINGEVSGAIHMTVSSSYSWTIYSDGGDTNGFKLLYVRFTAPIWGRGTGYEIGYCYGIAPLSMLDDSYIAHIGENDSSHTNNLIHHNYFQVSRIRNYGWGQDLFKWVGGASIFNNTLISAYNASYPGNQHNDGIQTASSHVWMYNNYIEGFISYPIYNEMYGSTSDWRIYNNIINGLVADRDLIDWGAYACMALGWSAPGVISDYIVSNNNCIGPTSSRPGIDLAGGVSGGSIGSGVYIVNNLAYNSGAPASHQAGATLSNNYTGTSGISFANIAPYPNGDFHLTSGATSAIDRGISPTYLTGFYTTDKDGSARVGTWDIGAFEYAAGGSSTPSAPIAPTNLTAVPQ